MNKALAAVVVVLAVAVGFLYVKPAPAPKAGAVSSLSNANSPVISVNGLSEYWNAAPLLSGTTGVVCAFQSPNATSTLSKASINLTTSTTTATTITMAQAATATATTTLIGSQVALAANAQATIIASTTAAQDAANNVTLFAPLQWFVVSLTGGIGTYSPKGLCTATFRQVSPGA